MKTERKQNIKKKKKKGEEEEDDVIIESETLTDQWANLQTVGGEEKKKKKEAQFPNTMAHNIPKLLPWTIKTSQK